jgi:hypothetical protein
MPQKTPSPGTEAPAAQFTLEELRRQQDGLRDKYTRWQLSEIPEDYAAKLRGEDGPTAIQKALAMTFRDQKKPGRQVMSYEDGRYMFWAILCGITRARNGSGFVVDANNMEVLPDIVRYLILDPTCSWPLHKGLMLSGSIGSGKTLLMDAMQIFAQSAPVPFRHFKIIRTVDLADKVRKSLDVLDDYSWDDYCFDDFGQEPREIMHYGDRVPVMERIIGRRYERFCYGKAITHMTTNLSPSEIADVYGSRVADRMREMFVVVPLDGASRRK